jgi:hypothetical protein
VAGQGGFGFRAEVSGGRAHTCAGSHKDRLLPAGPDGGDGQVGAREL